ncbi:MAG: flagellar biosynthesis protein FlhB [Alphaproteobacteria bacterium]
MAEGEDDSEKTEDASQKRLDDSRDKGQVPSSKEVNHWIMFLAMAIFLLGLAPPMARDLSYSLTIFLEQAHAMEITEESLPRILAATLGNVGMAIAPLAALFMVAAFGAGVIQNGFLFSAESLKPTLDKISPLAGIKRMFSMKSLAEFAKGILKLIIVGSIAAAVVMPEMLAVETLAGLAAGDLIDRIADIVAKLLLAVLSVMTAIAAADFLYQKYEHHKKLRMSRQDMKEEYKQSEGDPIIKQRLRQIRSERSRKRMIAEVPKADVVITNPTHFAVALKYDDMAMGAPIMLAKGVDKAALRIREVAKENGVPIVENPPLARALYASVGLEEQIPEEHYRAVAEVINYVWKLKGKRQ